MRSTTDVLTGQPKRIAARYRRYIGKTDNIFSEDEEAGYRNADLYNIINGIA